jgi:hypothetical protein
MDQEVESACQWQSRNQLWKMEKTQFLVEPNVRGKKKGKEGSINVHSHPVQIGTNCKYN